MKAIANSTPLIHLSKARALHILLKVYEEVTIPRAVYREVVDKGLERGFMDAELVRAAVEEGSIKVSEASNECVREVLKRAPMLHRGEAEVLALALRHKPCHVLLDDEVARDVAKVLGLEVHGTLYVLVTAAKRGVVTVEEALDIMDRLVAGGFRISAELYLKTRSVLLRLAGRAGQKRP